eukprot:symbB.v1.2.014770.t1/scaffold1084.1/size139254/9
MELGDLASLEMELDKWRGQVISERFGDCKGVVEAVVNMAKERLMTWRAVDHTWKEVIREVERIPSTLSSLTNQCQRLFRALKEAQLTKSTSSDVARMLLKQRAEVNKEALPLSPLSLACLSGKLPLVELLICAEAKLDGPDPNGGAPLLHGAYKNRMPICQLLLDSRASAQVSFQQSNSCLLAPPARPQQNASHHWQEVLHDTSGIARLEELHFCQGITALHLAAWHGNATMCKLLLDANARPNAQDVLARTALSFCAQRGHREAFTVLLERGAHTETADAIGHTAASWAAKMGQKHIVELLLEVIHPDFVPWYGAPSMLHVAAYHRRMGVVACLLAHHANPEVCLKPGALRPLMVAAFQGSVEICQLHHAAINEKDEEGTTAWQYAAISGHEEVCALLVAMGASE